MESLIKILELLYQGKMYSINELKGYLSSSESKVRVLLKELRVIGKDNGFEVRFVQDKGYSLDIIERDKFTIFFEKNRQMYMTDHSSKQNRISFILFIVCRAKQYVTLQEIAETLDVSRKTILNDMPELKEILLNYNLEIQAKSHYGIRIVGDEVNLRKLLKDVTVKIASTNKSIQQLMDEGEDIKFETIRKKFIALLDEHSIFLTRNAIDSILFHLRILVYRLQFGNMIKGINIDRSIIDDASYLIAKDLTDYILGEYRGVQINEEEVLFVASQIFGKKITHDIDSKVRSEQMKEIQRTLSKIDSEYGTKCAEDVMLNEGLLLHVYPLILRLSYGLELSNSLIRHLPIQYINSFLLALRFSGYHSELKNYSFSRDEIGYLALHFATYYERTNLIMIKNVKHILFIHENMRSESMLVILKIQQMFPIAKIKSVAKEKLSHYQVRDVHLIISTCPIPDFGRAQVLVGNQFNEEDMLNVRSSILFNYDAMQNKVLRIVDLFKEDLFFRAKENNYIEVINKYTKLMEKFGYAQIGFSESVLKRESKLDTIYENGVCTPHSLSALAKIDSVAIVILEKPIYYENKKIEFIFILNLQKGHMFLHQEISDFIMKTMHSKILLDKMRKATSLKEFKVYIE